MTSTTPGDEGPDRPVANFLEEQALRRKDQRSSQSQLSMLLITEGRLDSRHLGYPTVEEARALHEKTGNIMRAEADAGGTRHRRMSLLVRTIPGIVTLIDFAVLLTFCGVIFNVDLSKPFQYPIYAFIGFVLAFMASGVSYIWLSMTGRRLKDVRNPMGEIQWRMLGPTTWLMVGVSLLLVFVLSVLMYQRILNEVAGAGDAVAPGTQIALGLVFAILSAMGNLAVVAIHALDGSNIAEDHRISGKLLRQHERKVHKQMSTVLRTDRVPDQPVTTITQEDWQRHHRSA